MTTSKRRLYLILSLLLGIVFCLLVLQGTALLDTIAILTDIRDTLGKRYIERLSFEIAPYERQILRGEIEKFVLRAHDGNLWLFKTYPDKREVMKVLVVNKAAALLGIDVPRMYEITIPMNGMQKKGFLQELLPSRCRINTKGLRSLVAQRQSGPLSSILKNEIFSLLFYFRNVWELLQGADGKIYQIDIDNAFARPPHAVALGDKDFMFDVSKLRGIGLDFTQAAALLSHIDGINNGWLKKILISCFRKDDPAVLIDTMTSIVVGRKALLLKAYNDRYAALPGFSMKNFNRISSAFYRLAICRRLCGGILQECMHHIILKKQKNTNEISAIFSTKAWRYINEEEAPRYSNDDRELADRSVADVENQFMNMRYSCDDAREKLAITLYIRQLRTLKKYVDTYDHYEALSDGPDSPILPIIQDVRTFHYPQSVDEWYAHIQYQTRGKVPVADADGEAEYIQGLLQLINHKRDEGIKLLATAQARGYDPQEVAHVMNTALH